MGRPPRPCLHPGCPRLTTTGPRCPAHQTPDPYAGDWERRSRTARQAWIEQHGWTCPGYGVPAHPAVDLELDHTTGQVLCHRCNCAAGPALTQHKPEATH